MKHLYFFFLLLLTAPLFGQQSATGKLETSDTVSLQVIRIFPDSFPNVSVVFRAKGSNGQPISNLDSTNLKVTEDGVSCRIIRVQPVSTNWAVNTVLVIDHSGSMSEDALLHRHWDSLPAKAFTLKRITVRDYTEGEVDSDSMMTVREAPPNPQWYHSPMWHAQHAALSYINSTDVSKDLNGIIGFSTTPDNRIALTHDQSKVTNAVNGLWPSGETAFYDAVSVAIDEADKGNGIRAVIAMTDGKDNASRTSLNAVIQKAKDKRIPVYVIGLGDVEKQPLNRLAAETQGLAYFTSEASNLGSIYRRITQHLQTIYEVVYASPSLSSADSTRDVQLFFEIDDAYLSSRMLSLELPEEVVAKLAEKERALQQQAIVEPEPSPEPQTEIPWGTGGLILGVAAAGVLTARYFRKKPGTLQITNVYPNPTAGPVTVTLNRPPALPVTIFITNQNGATVLEIPSSADSTLSTDLSPLENGTYLISVQEGKNLTPARSVILTK